MDIVAYQGPVTGYGRTDTYDWERLASSRAIAHSELGDLGANLVRPELRSRALEIFSAWRRRSRHILGVHMRGTDKVVRRKVQPPLLTMAMLTIAILTKGVCAGRYGQQGLLSSSSGSSGGGGGGGCISSGGKAVVEYHSF